MKLIPDTTSTSIKRWKTTHRGETWRYKLQKVKLLIAWSKNYSFRRLSRWGVTQFEPANLSFLMMQRRGLESFSWAQGIVTILDALGRSECLPLLCLCPVCIMLLVSFVTFLHDRNLGRRAERITDDLISGEKPRAFVRPQCFIQEFFRLAEEKCNSLMWNPALHENRTLGGCRRALRVELRQDVRGLRLRNVVWERRGDTVASENAGNFAHLRVRCGYLEFNSPN